MVPNPNIRYRNMHLGRPLLNRLHMDGLHDTPRVDGSLGRGASDFPTYPTPKGIKPSHNAEGGRLGGEEESPLCCLLELGPQCPSNTRHLSPVLGSKQAEVSWDHGQASRPRRPNRVTLIAKDRDRASQQDRAPGDGKGIAWTPLSSLPNNLSAQSIQYCAPEIRFNCTPAAAGLAGAMLLVPQRKKSRKKKNPLDWLRLVQLCHFPWSVPRGMVCSSLKKTELGPILHEGSKGGIMVTMGRPFSSV
jgi:hypothetical protein